MTDVAGPWPAVQGDTAGRDAAHAELTRDRGLPGLNVVNGVFGRNARACYGVVGSRPSCGGGVRLAESR